jgi:hypothetical protein
MKLLLARKSALFLGFVACNLLLLCLVVLHAQFEQGRQQAYLLEKAELVNRLQLTDLSLFTDARYTRHPSMADLNTAFQDSPMSLDHFPSGTIIQPPLHLRERR